MIFYTSFQWRRKSRNWSIPIFRTPNLIPKHSKLQSNTPYPSTLLKLTRICLKNLKKYKISILISRWTRSRMPMSILGWMKKPFCKITSTTYPQNTVIFPISKFPPCCRSRLPIISPLKLMVSSKDDSKHSRESWLIFFRLFYHLSLSRWECW